MKRIPLLNVIITCLIIITSGLQAKENDIKTIQNISQINFILKLQFPNNTYVLNSSDKNLNEKLERLEDENFSKLETRTLSAQAPVNTNFSTIIPETKINNIRGALNTLLSAATVFYQGSRDLELGLKSKLTISHQADSTILLSPSISNNTAITYQIRSDIFLENLVVLMEKLNEILSDEPIDYSIFSQTSTKEIKEVTKFLNKQSCFILKQCVEASVMKSMRQQLLFTQLKEENLAKLFLGLNFDAYIYTYPVNDLSALYNLYFLKATNQDSINKILLRLESYINYSSQDPYKSLKQLEYLLTNFKSKPFIYNNLLKIDKEFRLKPVFTSDVSNMLEKVERSKDLLKKLITTNNSNFPYSTRFEIDVLRSNDTFPVDHTLIDYELFYQLYKRVLLEYDVDGATYYHSVYRVMLIMFLNENYEEKFIKSLILDMKASSEFRTALKSNFDDYWKLHDQYREFKWMFMLKVEEGYKYASPKKLESSINNRLKTLRQNRKDKTIKKEQSTLRWWQARYKDKQRSEKEFYKAIYSNVKKSHYPKDHAFTIADIFTKSIIIEIRNQNFKEAKLLVMYYIDKLLPLVGADDKTTDISSNALGLSVISKDDDLAKIVFSKLLGKDFKIDEINNEIFVYNLACYYATHKQKKSMFLAINRALRLGKKPEQFLKDTDFKYYLEDSDFISLLKDK